MTLSKALLILSTILLSKVVSAAPSHALKLYSETVYDSRFDGATTDSRLRYEPFNDRIKPFVGLNYSRDLSNGSAPLFTVNSWSPSIGITAEIFKKYLFSTVEYRKLITNQDIKDDEFRTGLYGYSYFNLLNLSVGHIFNETYSESFIVNRVSDKPYFVLFNKLGLRHQVAKNFKIDLYAEGFTKSSPDLGYGPSEHELRIGLRPTLRYKSVSASFIINYAPISNTKVDGFDALFILSGGFN